MEILHRHGLWALACLLSSVCLEPSISSGQSAITSSGLNTQVSGPIGVSGQTQFNITGGTRPAGGSNLFHSFGNFNVPNNNIANFLNNSGLATSNILGRVTGGNLSTILGTIQTTGFGNANLFLINPSGFLFGPTATVNVGGMVTFTSADYLRLADGVRFNAVPNAPADVLLSAAPVAAFGFLGSNPGAITLQGSQFSVTEGADISLVGGNITVQSAALRAPSGRINVVSVGRPLDPKTGGEVVIAPSGQELGFNPIGFATFGTINISQGSIIDVGVGSGSNPGSVFIRGGQIMLNETTIDASVGEGLGGDIAVQSGGRLDIQNSRLDTTSEIGFAGTIDLNAGRSIDLTDTTISASGGGLSPGGSVTMAAPVISLSNSAVNVSGANLQSDPVATISLTATKAVSLMNGTVLTADSTNPCTVCDAGTVLINGGRLFVSDRSIISARPWFGHGGTILLEASAIGLSDTLLTTSTKVPDISASVGGNIRVTTRMMATTNSQLLTAATEGQGGTIDIRSALLLRHGTVIDASSQSGIDGPVTINGVKP
jgi:filamentous hemagglutinin family protein